MSVLITLLYFIVRVMKIWTSGTKYSLWSFKYSFYEYSWGYVLNHARSLRWGFGLHGFPNHSAGRHFEISFHIDVKRISSVHALHLHAYAACLINYDATHHDQAFIHHPVLRCYSSWIAPPHMSGLPGTSSLKDILLLSSTTFWCRKIYEHLGEVHAFT